MNMEYFRKHLGLIAVFLGVLLVLLFWRTKSQPNTSTDSPLLAQDTKTVASSTPFGVGPSFHPGANPTVPPLDRMATLERALTTPIGFYGIVIDQNGSPVPGAKITYSIRNEFSLSDPKQVDAEPSDKDGRFSISGKHGASIFVNAAHPGYYRTDAAKRTFTYYQIPSQITHDKPPTPNDPAVFRLFKKGDAEPLVRSRSGSIAIPFDGSPTDLGFRNGHVKKISSGDVRVECSAVLSESSSSNAPFSWKCKISVPGGGLILRSDQWSFIAPEDGYVQADTIDMSKSDDPHWSDSASRNYFVRLQDGKYARCTIDIIPNGSHYVVLESYYNPSGSRNLEYDPAKQINPH